MAINLQKGQKIDLTKSNGRFLQNFCVGVNWGMIDKPSFFGFSSKKIAVDLDASCAIFDGLGNLLDVVYFGKLASADGAICHSGDDRAGDADGDDGLDNEVISVDLTRLNPNAQQLVFFLNSFLKQNFGTIPFAQIRLYEGTPRHVQQVYARYNIAQDASFANKIAMVLGKLYRRNGQWKFAAIGEATNDRDLQQTLMNITQNYL